MHADRIVTQVEPREGQECAVAKWKTGACRPVHGARENLKRVSRKMEKEKTKILAVAGKGGVGKTSIAATIVRILVEAYPDKKILAIDADPAVGLSTALGLSLIHI